MAISLNPRELKVSYPLRDFGTGAGVTPWLDIAGFPSGSLHVYADSGASFVATVEVANVEHDDHAVVLETLTAGSLVQLTKPAAFVRLNVASLSGGKLGATYAGRPQG